MGEMRTRSEELQELKRLIAEWNASRLDMFAISDPNEDLEYRGAMRFYFQDSGSKVATKCVRFTSMDSTGDVTKVLVEKFHPDMKMLSNPSYSLYEVHQNKESRKLRPDEYPLRIQLEWQNNDREGRFLLVSDTDKIVHSNIFETSKNDKTVDTVNLKRSLSRREKKQLKKKREEEAKKAEENKKSGKDDIAAQLYNELPETSFTRSISNPEAVMRRRRQQKIEKRLKDFQSKDAAAGGTLKIFATTLKPEIPYKTLLVSVDDNTTHVIQEALIKYQMEKENPEDYCLIMVNIPPEGHNTSATLGKERVVHDEDCPLKIAVTWPPSRGTVVFHLRRRANLPQHRQERRRSKSPSRKPIDRTPEKIGGDQIKQQLIPEHLLPYLQELSSEGMDPSYKPRVHRLQMNVTEVGSEKSMSAGGNYLVLHAPHILQRHCVITNMDGRVSVTPSSGDAEVSVNGKRFYETTTLMHNDVIKIGRAHTFRFCDPAFEKPSSRHSAPVGYPDDGSISSSSDMEAPRRQRPSSLGAPLQSPSYNNHYPSNDYPSPGSHDNLDQDTNGQNPGMFETTFDVTGEVTTYAGRNRDPEPLPRSPPPRTPTQTSFAHEDLFDDKLPATLEFLETGEDAFFAAVVSEVNGQAVHFKLAPTYTLYMCARFRMSPAYRPELNDHQRGERLGVTLLKIANMARSTIRDNNKYPGSLAFWMANCSELLHFIKQDRDISPYTKEGQPHGQQVLAQSVHQAFRDFVRCAQNELRTVMSAFIDPTDGADMEDSDLDSLHEKDADNLPEHSDGRSYHVYGPDGTLSGNDSWFGGRRTQGRATVSEVIYNLSSTMSLLRRCRVNAALTIQVFSQLFHFINTWLFNKLVLEPKLGLCTKDWGRRISKRLARVEKWAEKQGLELAADCHLCRIAQAAHLLQAPKNSSSDVSAISSSCFKLNSLQVRTLLENYRPGPDEYIPQDLVEAMVMTAEENADEVARSNGQEIQLEEDWELQLPFLLPEDGYSCEVIRGVPPGLKGFLEPLAKTGLCKLTLQPETSGLWTVYLKKYEKLSVDISNAPQSHEIEEIAFNKGRGGMGLSIVAAKGTRQKGLGIYIKQVVKDGPASKDGRLKAGDQILSVNGESLIDVTQERAAEVMVKSGPNVSLRILKQGAIYHGLATLLIQSPTKESPQRLTPLEPEHDLPQSSPTLPDSNVPGYLPRHNSTSMQEERFVDDRRRSEAEERLQEEQRLIDEEEQRMREEEERVREEQELRDRERMREEERLMEETRRKEEEEDHLRDEERRREEDLRIEEERARKEKEKRLYEERRRLEEEEERAREEENRRLEEQRSREAERQRQIKLEEERRRREAEEDEKFRIQEDRIRKRMEEERRIIEEERRKLAEERRLLEEERKKEEERKRSEQQRILDEQRRLEEEKKRIEEEKKRQMMELEERRRAEEERRRLQEEEEEEEAQIIAEEQRRRQELLRREEFRRREDQRRIAEERRRAEEEERRMANEPQKPRSRRIRFEDEVMPKVQTVEQQPPPFNSQPEVITKKNEVVEEEPVVVRGRLTEADISNMNAVFEKLEEEQPKDEPPRSPIRVDTRNTRYGRAIVITQGMIQAPQSPSSPIQTSKPVYDFEQQKQKQPEEKKETDFERWQRQQRELAERREQQLLQEQQHGERERRESEDRDRLQREEQERQQRERQQREQLERQQREQLERQERAERERRQREDRERQEREDRERQEREDRERQERENRERQERERQEEEQRLREERERRDQERRERMQKAKLERERREKEEQERQEREKQEAERKRKEQEEWERAEQERELERQRKEQQSLAEKMKQQEQHRERLDADRERLRVIERERKMLYPDDTGSKTTLDYIESMTEDEVEREFRRRLEAENKRKSDFQDRRAGGLVSVTRVTYHPDRNDQSERDRRLQMILQEQRILDKDRKRDDDETRRNFQATRDEAERKLQEEHQEDRRKQQLDLQRKVEEQNILREKENEARRQLQEEQRRRTDRGSDSDHVVELKERALRDYERRRGLIDLEIAKQQAHLKLQDEIRQKEFEEVQAKFDQQRPVSALKTTNGTKPKKQVSFSQMSTEIREPASPTYVVESSSGYTAKITPAASVRLVETRPPAIHTPPDSPLSSPPDSPPESPRDYPPIPRPPPPEYDEYDPPPLPPPPSELLEDDDDFPPPPPPRSPYSDRSSSSSSDPRSPVDTYQRNTVASGYGTYPRAARPMSYPAPADLDSIQLSDSFKYSGSNNNIIAMNTGIRETRSLGRIPVGGGTPPPIPKKPEQLGFRDKMKLFNQDKTPENKVTTSRWQREQYGVNGDITYT